MLHIRLRGTARFDAFGPPNVLRSHQRSSRFGVPAVDLHLIIDAAMLSNATDLDLGGESRADLQILFESIYRERRFILLYGEKIADD